jgi:hypothetical protein
MSQIHTDNQDVREILCQLREGGKKTYEQVAQYLCLSGLAVNRADVWNTIHGRYESKKVKKALIKLGLIARAKKRYRRFFEMSAEEYFEFEKYLGTMSFREWCMWKWSQDETDTGGVRQVNGRTG